MNNITSVDKSICTGCGACMNKCPLGAIETRPNEKGFFAPFVNEKECIHCGLCYKTCPAINAKGAKNEAKAYSAVCDQGGHNILSSLAEDIISNKGVVIGPGFTDDYMWVIHEQINSFDKIDDITKAISVHSDTRKTYFEAKTRLDNGDEVLYFGLPCQIDGLYSFLGKDYSGLYTVDFDCSGHSSVKAYQSFIKEISHGNEIARVELGDDSEIATAVYFKDKSQKKIPYSDSKWAEGENGIIKGDCCYNCKYLDNKRIADITIGKTVDDKSSETGKARIILISTKKGERLVERANNLSINEISIEAAELTRSLQKKSDREYFFSHIDEKGYHNALWYGKGMRFDTGIVGWWFASNYGSSLTYYALAKILEGSGRKPIFIHVPKLDGTSWDKDAQQTIDFIGKRFRIAKYRDMMHIHEVNNFCDSFMLGSDQMWTPLATQLVGYTFFLDFADLDKKKIAFSTSFGQDKFIADEKVCQTASDYLKRFDAISVREYTGVDICKETFGIEAEQIIDPVFLCTKRDYDELIKDVSIQLPKKYLLSYILDPTEEKEKAVEAIAEKEDLEVLSVFSMRDYEKNAAKWSVGKNVPKPSTEEFLYYVKNCSYMVTDSHHGACMGIIYERPYVAITNASRGVTRFETVAKALGLENRVLYSPNDAIENSQIHNPIDYESVNERIKREANRAKRWLDNAFEKETVVAKETVNTLEARLNATQISYTNTVNSYERRLETAGQVASAPVALPKELGESFDFVKIRLVATLLRDYGVKHIVLCPGGRDVPIVRMFENNESSFILHRVTDERSAGYYGLGIASKLGEPVACVCTSGTAASNYLPAVTEAYYTQIPLIMITADRLGVYHGQGEDQTIPQKDIYRDVVKMAISLPDNNGGATEHQIKRDVSACILETTHNVQGPVHINIPINDVSVGAKASKSQWSLLPTITPHILRASFINGDKEMHKWADALRKSPRVLIVYGQNKPLSEEEKKYLNVFASKYNCAIVTDSISNYNSEYSVNPFNMLSRISQEDFNNYLKPDILITVGGKRLMNDPLTFKIRSASGVRHWSVSPDGAIKDFYFKLTSVIESTQAQFFKWFSQNAQSSKNNRKYLNAWKELVAKHPVKLSESFDSFYVQDKFFPALPKNSYLHLGVGQTFFFVRRHDIDPSVEVYCNMGTNGIDGCASTFMGQCVVEKNKLCFLLIGDLAFFYDMNSIWNKQLTQNMRILLVNNNGSGLLRNHNLKAVTSVHNTSAEGWVSSTGFEYMSARSKEELDEKLKIFLSDKGNKPLFLEVFCN